jgi:hypothetical protein
LESPASPSPSPRAIVAPWLDASTTGGLALVGLALLLLLPGGPVAAQARPTLFVLGIALNWPHFIASYRVLYSSRESVRRYRAASIYFPAAVALYAIFATLTWSTSPIHYHVIIFVGSVYLARHYTGQAWGMVATSGYVTGVRIEPRERRLIHGSFDLLAVWHASWAAAQTIRLVAPSLVGAAEALYASMIWIALAALVAGAAGFALMSRRLGRLAPARLMLPWAAIVVWYALLAKDPTALLVVQIAHALQYMIFPLRLQINRAGAAGTPRAWSIAAWALGAWVLIGAAVFEGTGPLFKMFFRLGGGDGDLPSVVQTMAVSAIGIHHYFVDGALYKLRNPAVRRDLFAHLAADAAPAARKAA